MRVGIIAGVLAAAVLLGIGLGLVFLEAMAARMPVLAPQLCERVYDLRANFLARLLNRAELKDLWRHCERIADVAAGLEKLEKRPPE